MLRQAGKPEKPVIFLTSKWSVSLPASLHYQVEREIERRINFNRAVWTASGFELLEYYLRLLKATRQAGASASLTPFSPSWAVTALWLRTYCPLSFWSALLPSPSRNNFPFHLYVSSILSYILHFFLLLLSFLEASK